MLAVFDPGFDFFQTPDDATGGEAEAAREFAALFHFVDRRLGQGDDLALAATLEVSGLRLDADVANVHVRRWLDEVANARVHATTKAVPAVRLAEERAVMLAAPALEAPTPIHPRVALPIESLQHPLSVYDALLEVA